MLARAQEGPVVPTLAPQDADLAKGTGALGRAARSLLRRADKLASAVTVADDTTTPRAAAAGRDAVEQLVHQLIRLQQGQQRRARDAIRRGG